MNKKGRSKNSSILSRFKCKSYGRLQMEFLFRISNISFNILHNIFLNIKNKYY